MGISLILTRYSDNGNSTQGLLHVIDNNDLKFLNYTLEDEHRSVKVMHETCIPSGLYEVLQRKEITPMTERYRSKFDWFDFHLEIQNVEGFSGIYIHIGNKDEDTSGCVLVADNANNNTIKKGFNSSSTPAFERLYDLVRSELNNGGKVFIQIRDIENLM